MATTPRAEGTRGIRLAREAVEYGLAHAGRFRDIAAPFRDVELAPWFEEPKGVFVTFTEAVGGQLRGCVGFPMPIFPLRRGIPRAAWAAASEDPRFPPISAGELAHLLIELSVLTRPQRLREGTDRPSQIRIGRDGLIVEAEGSSGLLLPQVAVEQGWEARRFLNEVCRKAGLPPGAWEHEGTTLRTFQAELFRERSPGGPVESHELSPSPG